MRFSKRSSLLECKRYFHNIALSHIPIHIYTNTCTYEDVHANMRMYTNTCIHINMHAYTHQTEKIMAEKKHTSVRKSKQNRRKVTAFLQ